MKYKQHQNFKVNKLDLHTTIDINLYEALSGFNRLIKFLDGTHLKITSNKVINPINQYIVFNEGLRHKNNKGNLYIKFNVEYPQKLVVDNELNKLSNLLKQDKKGEKSVIGKIREVNFSKHN